MAPGDPAYGRRGDREAIDRRVEGSQGRVRKEDKRWV